MDYFGREKPLPNGPLYIIIALVTDDCSLHSYEYKGCKVWQLSAKISQHYK